ncbi:MAG: hypothetical protein R3Y64_08895 [Peptostreptococcaceae bacterium]
MKDDKIDIRTFKYSFEKVKENSKSQKDGIKILYFLKQKVISFEENSSIQYELKLIFPDNQEILYTRGI